MSVLSLEVLEPSISTLSTAETLALGASSLRYQLRPGDEMLVG